MKRILLVEDNEMNRDLIVRRLKRRGFEIETAADGAEGVEKATHHLPDLIVMDMGLPVLDGYEATRLLKDAEGTRRIPIIGLSAHAMSGDAQRALDAGCDDYDTKPMEWPRLLGKIDALLSRAQEKPAPSAETMATEDAAPTSKAHLLVVDDSAMHREMLAGRLTALGYTFDLASDGRDALDRLARQKYDALLLDVTLPDVDGQTTLSRVRSEERWQDLPILMLSTIDSQSNAAACLSQGAVDFVPQPFHQEVLAARLGNCIDLHRLRGKENRFDDELGGERRRVEHLLSTLLPGELVEELRQTRKIMPRRQPGVAVLFCDVAGFRHLSDRLEPLDSLQRLQRLIVAFEEISEAHRLQRIKTIGDSFMAAAGLFEPSPQAALDAVRCAMAMRQAAADLEKEWALRVGIHNGPVIAGVVGHRQYQFDLWGGTVQTASLVKRFGDPGGVHVSESVWREVAPRCSGLRLGEAPMHDGGNLMIYRVDTAS